MEHVATTTVSTTIGNLPDVGPPFAVQRWGRSQGPSTVKVKPARLHMGVDFHSGTCFRFGVFAMLHNLPLCNTDLPTTS